jgi:hypothetical protein
MSNFSNHISPSRKQWLNTAVPTITLHHKIMTEVYKKTYSLITIS